ncbi:MAG TPA: penicillin acylase family protein [Thermoanaerobaculia bacterium]
MRKLAIALLALILLAAALWFGGRVWLARSVMEYDGSVDVGVEALVEITFDERGVPQVWAASEGDAYFALGWLHASERLFQMELLRRLSYGELSEVFGEAAYETDVAQRRIGFGRRGRADASRLTAPARAALQRYVDGVNEAIERARPLPPELVILRLEPRRWTVEDCLVIAMYQSWFSHELMDADRRFQKVVELAGSDARALTTAAHPWSPPTVPDEFVERFLGPSRMQITAASNSWAVAPGRSKSGAALHASDPHLAIDQVPGLWYLAGLHSQDGLSVVGVTSVGMPFVVMGHNGAIAFSFTVAAIDLIDYFDDAKSNAVRTIRESIAVKGEKQPRILEVYETQRGVMIDETTSMHWAGFDFPPAPSIDAGLLLHRAKNFDDFRRAVTRFGALDANWIFSDRAGNIGYQLGAPVPMRNYDSLVRQRATDPEVTWTGYRPLDQTPHALNPADGFVASCNNQIVSAGSEYPLPGFFDPWRITRARELLSSSAPLGVDEMLRFQLDESSGIAARWKHLAGLGAWDGKMTASSREATLFAAWWKVLPRHIFEDELGKEWKAARSLVDQALTTESPLLDDRRTVHVESREEIAARARAEAKKIAGDRTWGEASMLVVRHPLARIELLDRWLRLNRGPFPAPGDGGSLNANFHAFNEETGMFSSELGASMRFVLDWSSVDSFVLTGALGQSGNPFSPHYDDFLPMQRNGESWTVPFTREAVFARATSVLRLE